MNIYEYLKVAVSGHVPGRIKLLGLYALLVSRRRMVGIFFDPVLACNLRCRMCYMSDPAGRAGKRGQRVDVATLDRMERALYRRALKLQIGCATEPTLYAGLADVVRRARAAGVPYISLTSNGQLFGSGRVDLDELVAAGLDELTLSLHGTSREVYEDLMPGASYEHLLSLTGKIADIKKRYPGFKLRVNYTVNSLNIHDLEADKFWSLWPEGARPDIVQLRPVQNMGSTEWNDFDLTPLKQNYSTTIGAIRERCAADGILCIAPELTQIDEVATDQDFISALIKEVTYCYVSPEFVYADDFGTGDDFASYHRRRHTARHLLRAAFSFRGKSSKRDSTKHLNYNVR